MSAKTNCPKIILAFQLNGSCESIVVFAIRQAIPIQEYTNKQEPCSSPTSHDPKCATLCQCAFRTRAYIIQ